MLIRRCDRCGALINARREKNNINANINAIVKGWHLLDDSFASSRGYNLCPDCIKSFDNWLRNKAPAGVCTTIDESKEI